MINKSRGVVILYEDLTERWANWMKDAHLTTIGVHKVCRPGDDSIGRLMKQLDAPDGRKVIYDLENSGVRVEYELHSLEWLLPRSLFEKYPELFRVNGEGKRSNDCNMCPSNEKALEIVSENACKLAKLLGQSSDNYFFWLDDIDNSTCNCEKCKAAGYSGSDQNMLIVNAIAAGLKAYNSNARAAYLAYADAQQLPKVKPADNVFLEFAPMNRNHDKPIASPDEERGRHYVRLLDELLTIFRPEDTHVLEYWLDNAMFSGYKMPPVKVPFNAAVADADTGFYTSRGIANVKTFASYIGDEYVRLHGEPPIKLYGQILEKYIKI